MGKFWKEAIGGQVQQGVYQASPRHASKQYGSFKTGRPPRLPFQFVVYFEINPQVVGVADKDKYNYSSLVRAIDLPSVTFTVEKKNSYNKMKPVLLSKDFKPFTLSVYDDIESRWYALWQHYYNWHFMDGRFDQKEGKDLSVGARDREIHTGTELNLADDEIGTSTSPYDHQHNGMDVHSRTHSNYFDAIHVFQIHADTVTRTTAINPILTDAQVTQLDYASTGMASEILFNIDYEKLAYGPVLNYKYTDDSILHELIEDVTKSTPFDPAQDKLKGLVKGLFGLEQSNIGTATNPMADIGRDLEGHTTPVQHTNLQREGDNTTKGGFFSNLISNALDRKIDEATSSLFNKQNKNINKINFN